MERFRAMAFGIRVMERTGTGRCGERDPRPSQGECWLILSGTSAFSKENRHLSCMKKNISTLIQSCIQHYSDYPHIWQQDSDQQHVWSSLAMSPGARAGPNVGHWRMTSHGLCRWQITSKEVLAVRILPLRTERTTILTYLAFRFLMQDRGKSTNLHYKTTFPRVSVKYYKQTPNTCRDPDGRIM